MLLFLLFLCGCVTDSRKIIALYPHRQDGVAKDVSQVKNMLVDVKVEAMENVRSNNVVVLKGSHLQAASYVRWLREPAVLLQEFLSMQFNPVKEGGEKLKVNLQTCYFDSQNRQYYAKAVIIWKQKHHVLNQQAAQPDVVLRLLAYDIVKTVASVK